MGQAFSTYLSCQVEKIVAYIEVYPFLHNQGGPPNNATWDIAVDADKWYRSPAKEGASSSRIVSRFLGLLFLLVCFRQRRILALFLPRPSQADMSSQN